MGLERLAALAVVEGVIGIKPVAFRVYGEVDDLREFRSLDEELPLGNQAGDEFDFVVVEMKLRSIQLPVHIRVRKENLCRAAFDNNVEDLRPTQLVERLRGQDHRRVVLPPGLQGLDNVTLN